MAIRELAAGPMCTPPKGATTSCQGSARYMSRDADAVRSISLFIAASPIVKSRYYEFCRTQWSCGVTCRLRATNDNHGGIGRSDDSQHSGGAYFRCGIALTERVEQRLRLFEVQRVEALGEPAVNRVDEPRELHCSGLDRSPAGKGLWPPAIPIRCALSPSHLDHPLSAWLDSLIVGAVQVQQELRTQMMKTSDTLLLVGLRGELEPATRCSPSASPGAASPRCAAPGSGAPCSATGLPDLGA